MTEEQECCTEGHGHKRGKAMDNGSWGAFYGLGMIGAAVYFIQQATSFWGGVLGFLKALVWPAFLIHKAFGLLKM